MESKAGFVDRGSAVKKSSRPPEDEEWFGSHISLPQESWDLKTGGLEIPDPCYTHPNPSIAGSIDS